MRARRTTRLIATFEGGYANGWAFAVRPCFKDQLDIKLTERKIDKKKKLVWTQGRNFCFEVGDIVYSTPLAYEDWHSAIVQGGFRYVQVTDAKPAGDPNSDNPEGYVTFKICRVSHRNKHSIFGNFTTPQHAFVKLLKTGNLTNYEESAVQPRDKFSEKKPTLIPLGETARITDIRRSIERLYGILFGISCDGEINDIEIQALKSWMPLHANLHMHQPFYSVIKVLERLDFKYEDILMCCSCFKNADFVVPRDGSIIRRFHGILQGISCDGQISEKEIDSVNKWIDKYAQPVRYDWPISEFCDLATKRGSNIVDFCKQFCEVRLSRPAPRENTPGFMRSAAPFVEPFKCELDISSKIEFNGRTFCFTGASIEFKRSELKKMVDDAGGTCIDQVSYILDYLVVCGQGNPNWAFSTYGRKIANAIEFNRIPDPHKIRKKIIILNEKRLLDEIGHRQVK